MTNQAKPELPAMSAAERADLEREAGRRFVSDEQAYEYLRRKVGEEAVRRDLVARIR